MLVAFGDIEELVLFLVAPIAHAMGVSGILLFFTFSTGGTVLSEVTGTIPLGLVQLGLW